MAKNDTALQSTQADDEKSPTQGGSISWSASEYVDHRQGFGWYAMLALVTALLAAGIYFVAKDYFATGTVIILGLIVGIFAARTPDQLDYQLDSRQVKIGAKNHPYGVFKSFSIVKEDNLSSISLLPIKRFMPPISIFFDPADESKIIDLLGKYLPYAQHRPDNIERLARRLRF